LTQSPLDPPRETSQEMSNLLDVSLRTLSSTPKAFYDELAADFSKHLPDVVTRVGEGAVIGVAGTLLLKVPKVAPVVITAGLLYTGYKAFTAADDFVGKATKADTTAQRENVAHNSAYQLGGTLSAFVESAPGMIAGGYGASRAFGAPPLYTRIGDAVDRSVLAPAREAYAFGGPGSVKLSSSLVNQEGEFDALAAGKALAQRQHWQGVETGASLDLAKLRASRVVTGETDFIHSLPGVPRENVVPFHIHGPNAGAGFLPSNVDVAATPGLGILQQGDVTTFYVGQAKEYASLAKAGNGDYFLPSLKAVVVDNKTGLAQRFTGRWLLGGARQLDEPVNLDFGKLLENMSRVRVGDPWASMAAIAAKAGS
jgi:hypothetical protein